VLVLLEMASVPTQVVMIIHDFSLVPWTRPFPKPCPTDLDFTSSTPQLLYTNAHVSTLYTTAELRNTARCIILSTHLAPPRSMASGLCSPNDHATFLQAFVTSVRAAPQFETFPTPNHDTRHNKDLRTRTNFLFRKSIISCRATLGPSTSPLLPFRHKVDRVSRVFRDQKTVPNDKQTCRKTKKIDKAKRHNKNQCNRHVRQHKTRLFLVEMNKIILKNDKK